MKRDAKSTSRRTALKAGLGIIAGTGAAAVAAARAQAQTAKVAQSDCAYQTTPENGGCQCSQCVHWEPPNACKWVAGTISPSGWCEFWCDKNC